MVGLPGEPPSHINAQIITELQHQHQLQLAEKNAQIALSETTTAKYYFSSQSSWSL